MRTVPVNLRSVLIFVYSKTLVKKYQCGIMCIVKLAVGYIVFEQKQIPLMADEEPPARISHRPFATSCQGMRITMDLFDYMRENTIKQE